MAFKLQLNAGGNGVGVVVQGVNGDIRLLAGRVNVTVGLQEDDDGRVGNDHAASAHDFTIAGVGHVRFNPVAIIALAGIDLGGQGHVQHAVGIQLPRALADLLPEIVLVEISFALVTFKLLVAPKDSPVGELIAGAENGILHLAAGDGRAKIITRADGALDRLTLKISRLVGGNRHLKLRLLVFLHFE